VKNKAYLRVIALALVAMILAACHEPDYYDPTPEVVISYERWDYDSVSNTYILTLELENIGDDDARNVSVDLKFGIPTVVESAFEGVNYIPYGSRRTITVGNLLYDYSNDYHAKLVWYDRYGYSYSTYY